MNKVYPIRAASGLEGNIGKFFKLTAGKPVICAAATDLPVGCLDHQHDDTRGGLALNGAETRVLVSATVAQHSFGKLNADGTASVYAAEANEVRVCQFLQAGKAGEYVNAIIQF